MSNRISKITKNKAKKEANRNTKEYKLVQKFKRYYKQFKDKYVKDTIYDVDASNETTFRRWLATMIGNGIPIDWDEII